MLLILGYSLLMSIFYQSLIVSENVRLSEEQAAAIVSSLVELFIFARTLWTTLAILNVFRLTISPESKLIVKKRINKCLKEFLFLTLAFISQYLKIDSIVQITSVEKIPQSMVSTGCAWAINLMVMTICIRMFWRQLNKTMLVARVTSNEPLNMDVCKDKVYFDNDWDKFIRVLEVGTTYRYNETGNLYCMPGCKDVYTTESKTLREDTISVAMRYSTVTNECVRLDAPRVYYEKGKSEGMLIS